MSEDIRQIGILGGSFDPVHMGHIGLAQETYEKFGLDQILFVPVFQSPHKKHIPMTTICHRMAMLRLALQNSAHFEISDMEVRREEISYTIDTLNRFTLIYPSSELFLIIGYDNLLELDAWKDSLKIIKSYNILVASRPGINLISLISCLTNKSCFKISSRSTLSDSISICTGRFAFVLKVSILSFF